MQTFLLIIFGLIAGVVGGMGMGGGTFLVPLLTFLQLPQKTIQAINLICFLPMCSVALIFHFKHKLVQTKHVLWLIIPAVLFAVLGAWLTNKVDNDVLKKCFAVFLIVVGVWQFVKGVNSCKSNKKQKESICVDSHN